MYNEVIFTKKETYRITNDTREMVSPAGPDKYFYKKIASELCF